MNLTKKIIDIDDRYTMYFDMESVLMYKEAEKSFIKGYSSLCKFEDDAVLDFIACTLRDKENDNKPVGFDFVKENPLYFLINYGFTAITLVAEGFVSDNNSNNVKKK